MTPSGMRKSLHAVAAIEAAKGTVVLLAGFGLLSLLHRDLHAVSCSIVTHLHLNPAKQHPRIFIDLLTSLDDRKLWFLAGMALLYATIRFFEAYGLWRGKTWAEWLALGGAGIYLPFEIYEIGIKVTVIHVAALFFNLLVMLLMAWVLLKKRNQVTSTKV